MKRVFVIFTIILLLTSCSQSGALGAPTSTIAPTVSIAPTETNAPTPTPEPLPCNIVFVSDRDGNQEIYTMGPDGSNTVNLSNHPDQDFEPDWSPDGSQIAFVSNRVVDDTIGQFVFVMNADGSDVHKLVQIDNYQRLPDWSHDGRMITFTAANDIFIIPVDGNGPAINLTNSPDLEDSSSTWSPDGSKIAWVSGTGEGRNVFVMDPDGSNVLQITDNNQGFHVEWTVDGKLLTGWGWQDQQEFCHNCVVDRDGTNIVDGGGKGTLQLYVPFWTASGDRAELAAVDNFEGNNEVYILTDKLPDTLDIGIGIINLTNNPASDEQVDWPSQCGPADKSLPVQNAAPTVDAEASETEPAQLMLGYAGDKPEHDQRKADFDKACEELNINCNAGDIPDLLAIGVSAIVLNSDNAAVNDLRDEIRLSLDKGVPIFLLDAETDVEGVFSVSIDHHEWAKTRLGWLIEQSGKKGELAFFSGKPEYDYEAVLEEMLERYPDMRVAMQRDATYEYDQLRQDVRQETSLNKNLKVIWTTELMSEAFWGMLEAERPPQDRPLTMCAPTKEGLCYWSDRVKEYPNFQCIAVSNPPGIAYDAAYAAFFAANGSQVNEAALGGKYSRTLKVNLITVMPENLAEWMDKVKWEADDYMPDAFMTPEEIKAEWFK